jgi:hypothetical protein
MEGERERKKSVVDIVGVTTVILKSGSSFIKSMGDTVVLEPLAARVEENLLGCHVVLVEKSYEDTGLLVNTLLSPELLTFCEIRDRVVLIRTGRATSATVNATRSTRRYWRAATVVTETGAVVIAGLFSVVTVTAARAVMGTPSVFVAECEFTHGFGAREPDDDVLHRFQPER